MFAPGPGISNWPSLGDVDAVKSLLDGITESGVDQRIGNVLKMPDTLCRNGIPEGKEKP
jgi:hypothetical protein